MGTSALGSSKRPRVVIAVEDSILAERLRREMRRLGCDVTIHGRAKLLNSLLKQTTPTLLLISRRVIIDGGGVLNIEVPHITLWPNPGGHELDRHSRTKSSLAVFDTESGSLEPLLHMCRAALPRQFTSAEQAARTRALDNVQASGRKLRESTDGYRAARQRTQPLMQAATERMNQSLAEYEQTIQEALPYFTDRSELFESLTTAAPR